MNDLADWFEDVGIKEGPTLRPMFLSVAISIRKIRSMLSGR
jgi:hypothetical protein